MVEESAQVVKVEDEVVWVQAIQQSACGSCQAQKGCGHSLLAKVGQKAIELPVARNGVEVSEHDQVIIGVPEEAILRSSLLMYGFPLAVMIAAALIASLVGAAEGIVILSSFIALITGFIGVSIFAKSLNFALWHPRLLKKISNDQSRIPMCEV